MSDPIDIIEHMFEYEGMQTAAALRSPDSERAGGAVLRVLVARVRCGERPPRGRSGGARRITSLRSRVSDMESTRVDTAGLPTASALEPLLPGGAIRAGGTYAVPESVLLG